MGSIHQVAPTIKVPLIALNPKPKLPPKSVYPRRLIWKNVVFQVVGIQAEGDFRGNRHVPSSPATYGKKQLPLLQCTNTLTQRHIQRVWRPHALITGTKQNWDGGSNKNSAPSPFCRAKLGKRKSQQQWREPIREESSEGNVSKGNTPVDTGVYTRVSNSHTSPTSFQKLALHRPGYFKNSWFWVIWNKGYTVCPSWPRKFQHNVLLTCPECLSSCALAPRTPRAKNYFNRWA